MTNAEVSVKAALKLDLTTAMKARDETTTSTLRMVLSAITNAEVAGSSLVVLTDVQVVGVLRAEAKKRLEAAEIYEQHDRAQAAAKERAELAVVERYLPTAMSDDQLAAIVDEEVASARSAGVDDQKAMGAVVKAVRDRAGPSAEGGRIAALVKAALSL